MFFNFALEYAIRRVQVTQDGLKLNGTHQLLVYGDDGSLLGGSVYTIKENAGAFLVVSTEIGLEVNADKTKYRVMFCDQNTARSHSIKTDNSFFAGVEEFKYLGTTLINQNSIQEEIKNNEVWEGLLSFGAESFVYQFVTQKFKD